MSNASENLDVAKQTASASMEDPVTDRTGVIVDNRLRRMGEFLRNNIQPGAKLSVVSAYFTIYAYEALRDVLEQSGHLRFLYGEPSATGTPDPSGGQNKSFLLNEVSGMDLRHTLAQKPLARACADWVRRQVDIRTIKQANFLHGKLYHIKNERRTVAVVGSSNFTVRGLGFGTVPNVELNLEVCGGAEQQALQSWFDGLWNDQDLTQDAKADVLAALERLGQPYAPEFIYYKTLFHVFENWLERHGEHDGLLHNIHLHVTEIWKALYSFQRDGATSTINRLLRYNGCIIADSVGLGKTWTALAVIKFFELRNERVLVLCPARLKQNWVRYTARAASHQNPFDQDRLNYTVLAHTDLSRYKGTSGDIDLAQFNWGVFDLVVIDESHNFRNEGRDRRDEDGNLVSRSRYNRLMEEVMKDGVRTKVLMLSATPVNTSLRDLRNQIYLMTEKRENTFQDELGISNIQSLFGVAQRAFQQWEALRNSGHQPNKEALLERLGADFLSLLDAVSFARSRDHIRRYYPDVATDIGGFPERAKPQNLYPLTDKMGTLSYDNLHRRIGNLRLAIYEPSQYLKDKSKLDEEKSNRRFDQRDREHWLIGMLRVNLLKRLESSVHSFTLTLNRILEKTDDIDRLIEKWRETGTVIERYFRPDDDEEDEEFAIGKSRPYRLNELNTDLWQKHLREDRQVLREMYNEAQQVTVERDTKLADLKRVLQEKVESAPKDKDGRANRKALVFTTFADTAKYLYKQLYNWATDDLGVAIALVTGGGGNHSSLKETDFIRILSRFAPKAQQSQDGGDEIDIMIATDCLSEGQDLQDCDLVVNYDIHWNPVRLMQRFGRIDRLGSRNKQVAMTNFWPTADLDRYLDLKNRVESRMALADATATGLDDPLNQSSETEADYKEPVQLELRFRDQQLARMRDEVLDLEEAEDGINLNDLTLDDFIADLMNFVQQNRAALKGAPLGIYAVADRSTSTGLHPPANQIQPGAIFCLKRNGDETARTPNRLWPYFLVYVQDNGTVKYNFVQARQCLSLFRALSVNRSNFRTELENAFDRETEQGRHMTRYDTLLDAALRSITQEFSKAELIDLGRSRNAVLTKKPQRLNAVRDFTLVTWLVIANEESNN